MNALIEIFQRQTRNFCYDTLSVINIRVHGRGQANRDSLIKPIKSKLRQLTSQTDRVIFISEILIYIGELLDEDEEVSSDLDTIELIQDIQLFLVRELERMSIGIDKNAFSNEEIRDLTRKIDKIIEKLEEISVGQEVVFDRVDELKNDYKDLLISFGLGKKPFIQRFAGLAAAYIGEKGADEVFNLIKPLAKDVVDNAVKLLASS